MSARSVTASLLALLLLGGVTRAQERTDDPPDVLGPSGRTEKPTGPAPKSDRRVVPLDQGEPASAPAKPERTDAPWSWPWGGAVRSPAWTQDENWVTTRVWLMDVGHVQLEGVWEGSVARRSYEVDQLYRLKARIGLLPHIELSITENATLYTHDHVRQEGNEIGARFAFWDYGTIPLNPAIELVWHPRHEKADAYEARGLVGFELFDGFVIAGNAFFMGETGGSHDYTWGFRGGVAWELWHEVLRVGCEGGVSWHWNRDHDKTPFRDTAPSVGPTVLFRPLALVKKEWGNIAKLTLSAELGIRDDNKEQPFMKGGAVLAFGF